MLWIDGQRRMGGPETKLLETCIFSSQKNQIENFHKLNLDIQKNVKNRTRNKELHNMPT